MSRRNRTEITVGKGVADVVEFGVIERVEEFRAEFQFAAASLAEYKLLKQSEVPVLTARATDAVERQVAPGSSHGWGECGRTEPALHRLRILNAPTYVGPIIRIGNDAADVTGAGKRTRALYGIVVDPLGAVLNTAFRDMDRRRPFAG